MPQGIRFNIDAFVWAETARQIQEAMRASSGTILVDSMPNEWKIETTSKLTLKDIGVGNLYIPSDAMTNMKVQISSIRCFSFRNELRFVEDETKPLVRILI